jgi:hypothetical protein
MRFGIASPKKLIAVEIIAGIVGTLAAFFVLNFVNENYLDLSNYKLQVTFIIIVLYAIVFVSSSLVYLVGKYNSKHGSYTFTLFGSILGFGISIIAVYLIVTIGFRVYSINPFPAFISGAYLIIPSIGATIGYNLKRAIKQKEQQKASL